MSALTSIFNFIYVYFRALVCLIFGGFFDVSHFDNVEQKEIARTMIISGTNGLYENWVFFSDKPLLLIIVGIFVIGSVIGLVKRIMR